MDRIVKTIRLWKGIGTKHRIVACNFSVEVIMELSKYFTFMMSFEEQTMTLDIHLMKRS